MEAVSREVGRMDVKESHYFNTEDRAVHPPRAEVITIDDDEDDREAEARAREEKRKLSMSDYKKRQLKIYDFAESPAQPNFTSPIRSKSNPVGQIIDNHIQNTPKKKGQVTSEDEMEEDLDTTRCAAPPQSYWNLVHS